MAKRNGVSLSATIRDLIDRQLQAQEAEHEDRMREHEAVFDRIRKHREQVLAERGGKPIDMDVVELINQMREERTEHLYRVLAEDGG